MVMCDRESVRSSFRLSGAGSVEGGGGSVVTGGGARVGFDTVSSASMYKQKIDAMFDDTRSVTSHGTYGPNLRTNLTRENSKVGSMRATKAPLFPEEEENEYNKKGSNSVQDRIEKMFAEMSIDSKGPLSDNIGVHTFSVDYLGSTPLQQKVTSLSGLQLPLKNLYFAYRKSLRHKTALTGQLEISKAGLKVRSQGEKGVLEQLNPFPTIAVWSAVKFVVQASEKENNILNYAFLPLITDPDNIDKQLLFKVLEPAEKKYILSHNENAHSPLFAVVMRKIGVAKQLECHGFVCQTSEDAIVIAATLYKSLMSHMNQQVHVDPNKSKKKLKNRNGVSCMSVASSNLNNNNEPPVRPPRKKRSTSSASGDSDMNDEVQDQPAIGSVRGQIKALKTKKSLIDSEPPLPPPLPANNKLSSVELVKAKLESIKNVNENSSGKDSDSSCKSIFNESADYLSKQHKNINQNNSNSSNASTVKSIVSEKIEIFSKLEKRKSPPRPSTNPPPIPAKPPELRKDEETIKETLRRKQSVRKSVSDSGDILTKVAIPRSGSFLNAGGLTRYKSIGQRNSGKKGGGSPLGFNELFNEFRVQENLHSMDEILSAIIDSEGMSFNDLKPIYKEFLLKLAVTLTKDEIFQHSKAIMKRQKKKITRKNSSVQNKRKKMLIGARGLKMVFRKPFGKDLKKKESKLKDKLIEPKHYEFKNLAANIKDILVSESSVSTSSYDLTNFSPKEPALPPPKRQSLRKRNSKRSDKLIHISKRTGKQVRPGERTSTSEESDFLTLSGRLGCHRNSSSGYVSCSECESESCIDRCYCSLKDDCKSKCYCSAVEMLKEECPRVKKNRCKDCVSRNTRCFEPECDYYSWCDCDSESCADSTKCYCRGNFRKSKHKNSQTKPSQPKASVKSSKSLQYFEAGERPERAPYGDRLRRAFDPSLYEPLETKPRQRQPALERRGTYSGKSQNNDNLALDYEIFLMNKGMKDANFKRGSKRLTVRSTGGQDTLSVKKSVEMAAVFADVRLSQRTDVRNMLPSSRTDVRNVLSSSRNMFSARNGVYTASAYGHLPVTRKTSLEDTLGYLP